MKHKYIKHIPTQCCYPLKEDGKTIIYSVQEVEVPEGYTAEYSSENYSNTDTITITGTPTIEDEIEQAIEAVETVKNDYVDGVNRDEIVVILSPEKYGALRNKVNQYMNSNELGQVRSYEGGIFNNARVYSSVRLPQGIDYVVMHDGAVAQPIRTSIYNPKPIPLSDAVSFGMFTYAGTTAVEPDLIFYAGEKVSQ